ncbi:MAG: TIGR02099 family protein [Gammaproteobacteria bacterium]|nr:TIGR02099 family protein [Gammaproteobacteria bacterium]
MLHIAKSLALKIWLVVLLILVLGAAAIVFGRLLVIPTVADYRVDVERWATEGLGREVRIGALNARWLGLGPELILKDVKLLSRETGKPSLRLSEIRIHVALIDSIRAWGIKTREVTLSGVHLLVKRRSNRSLVVVGLENLEGETEDATPLFLLPSRVVVKDSLIFWENQVIGAEPIRLKNVVAKLINAPGRHQLNGSFELPGEKGGRLELAMDIKSTLTGSGDWDGDIYLKGRRLALSELLRHRIPEGYELSGGLGNIELWSRWEDGHIARLEGSASTHGLRLKQFMRKEGKRERALGIDNLGGRFKWQRNTDGWTLDVADIELKRMGLSWPTANFTLKTRIDPKGKLHLAAGSDFVRIEDLVDIIRVFPLPDPAIEQALDKIWPHSDLYHLRFNYNETADAPRWSARGEVRSLFTRPWKRIPGMSNLQARFQADQSGGRLKISGKETTLRFPGLLRDPLVLEQFNGSLDWGIEKDGSWHISTNNIRAITNDIRTQTRLTMKFPSQPDTPVFMDLQTNFADGNAASTSRYLPVGIMPDKVVEWLDRSIITGQVISGSCIFRGPLRGFPFDETHAGRFEVFFHTRDLVLDYWPGWPKLEAINARVRFLDNSFDAWLEQGTLFQSELKHAHGRISRLKQGSPFELRGVIEGPLQDNLRILRESPLKNRFGPIVRGLLGKGDARLEMGFAIPIKKQDAYRLDGKLTFHKNDLVLDTWGLTLKSITGDLLFDLNGLQSKNLRADALGSTIKLKLKTREKSSDTTRITAQGRIGSAELANQFPALSLGYLAGKGLWNLQFDAPHHLSAPDHGVSVKLFSDLRGIEVDLPPPLNKKAAEKRNLTITGTIGQPPRSQVRLRYGSLIDAALQIETGKKSPPFLERGEIRIGRGKARIPGQSGLAVYGSLEKLDLGPWLGLMEESSSRGARPTIRSIILGIDKLTLGDTLLEQFEVDLSHHDGGLKGKLSSTDFTGSIQIPDALTDKPIDVNLDQLHLNFDPAQLTLPSGENPKRRDHTDPSQLPALSLNADTVTINQHDFGRLQLISRRVPNGIELQTLSLNSDRVRLSAAGDWLKTPGNTHKTRLDLSFETTGLGRLLEQLGFTRNIDQAPSEFDSRLSWNDSPLGFSTGILNGDITMQIGKGQFLEVDPGIGRVFGLLNFNALQRRLTLDFSDLFKKGLAFDNIEGSFLLDSGDAFTSDFRLRGPAAAVEVSGRIGLTTEDFEQLITITPRVSAALPVAGAIVGGPALGAAVLFAQQLLGKAFDKASQRQYQVTGPWENPEIERLDTQKKTQNSGRKTEIPTLTPPLEQGL